MEDYGEGGGGKGLNEDYGEGGGGKGLNGRLW